jgi:hypothetical protein
MSRLVRSPRSPAWMLVLGMAALLALSGCGDATQPPPSSNKAATPTATPTIAVPAGWQTYNDAAFTYSVQYPPDWASLLEPQPQGAPYEVVGFFAKGAASNGTAPTQNVITVTGSHSRPDTTDAGTPPGYAPAGKVTVAGTNQTMYVGPGYNGQGQGLVVLVAEGQQLYLFYSTADTASEAQFKQTFLKMLASFQILSPQG